MRSYIVNTTLLAAVIIAVLLFTIKYNKPQNIDNIKAGLSGIDKYLSNGSHIGYTCTIDDSELPHVVNYLLAPAYLDMLNVTKLDTTLIIVPIDQKAIDMIGQANILWQNKDDRYKYILISKH